MHDTLSLIATGYVRHIYTCLNAADVHFFHFYQENEMLRRFAIFCKFFFFFVSRLTRTMHLICQTILEV